MSVTNLPSALRGQDERIIIETDCLTAQISANGYVSGVAGGSLVDRKTGACDCSFGLDVVDFLLEPGSEGGFPYVNGDLYHGDLPKHYVELPQICGQAGRLEPEFTVGADFVAVRQSWNWTEAPPGLNPGSLWEQVLVFPMERRYFLSSDCVQSANNYDEVFLRIDMPGHLKHDRGDAFEEIYLSYEGRIPAAEFLEDFPPDAGHLYHRSHDAMPSRFIRAQKLRGEGMPWLAGITLDPEMVSEAWCHQRGYVCFIQEIGQMPVGVGEHFASANLIGYFDSIDEMESENDRYSHFTSLEFTQNFWLLSEGVILRDEANRFHIVPQGSSASPDNWQVLAHGYGQAIINGRRFLIEGEHVLDVPAAG